MTNKQSEEETPVARLPYASSGQADAALDVFRRLVPKKIDKDFVVANNLATATNAFRVLDFYKWFGIIDSQGNVVNEVADKLRLVGKEREDYIRSLIQKGYHELFSSVTLSQARKEDIVNFFISRYRFTHIQAKFAAALFIHLCQKYEIQMSEELKKKTHFIDSNKESKKKVIRNRKVEQKPNYEKKEEEPSPPVTGKNEVILSVRGNGINKSFPVNNKEDLDKVYTGKFKDAIDAAKLLCFDEE